MLGEGIKLEYKMEKGEVLEYKSTVHSEQEILEKGQSSTQVSDLEMLLSQEAKDIDIDGTMIVQVNIKKGVLRLEGKEDELPNVGQSIAMRMKKNGEITQSSVDFPFTQPPFPEKIIKQGETWTSQSRVEIPGRAEPVFLTYHYSLWGTKTVNGYECAEIKVSCPETEVMIQENMKQKISAIGTTYFAPQAGRLIRSEVETSTEITSEGMQLKNSIAVLVELVAAAGGSLPDQGFIAR
jgi:hypothetical protein